MQSVFQDPFSALDPRISISQIIAEPIKYNKLLYGKGEITFPISPGAECRFAKRCLYADEHCKAKRPELVEVTPGHVVACHQCGRSEQ